MAKKEVEKNKQIEIYEKTDYSNQDFTDLIKQVNSEYQLSYDAQKPKWDKWTIRLKIYNNQKKDKEAIGDPLLFKIHQTVLASLYDDKLSVDFLAREDGDQETAENLNALAVFDYDEMEKEITDYFWNWDATFFGRGFVKLLEYDSITKTPIPENLDPMSLLHDPRASSVNGDKKGRGSCRFIGYYFQATKWELETTGNYFNLNKLKTDTSINDPQQEAKRARNEAAGLNYDTKKEQLEGENQGYNLLEWFTMKKGKLVLVTLANNRSLVVGYKILWTNKDQTRRYIPIEDRVIYPVPFNWDSVSVPDMVEDKQRARAAIQNLTLQGIKCGLYPMYLYDRTRIKNRSDLTKFQFNKTIPVDGDIGGAVAEVPRQTVKNDTTWILNELDAAAQGATATPDIQQGNITKVQRTATELSLAAKGVDTRYSLSAKIFGWSEKRFWRQWYNLYKKHFNEKIDKKIIRIKGINTVFRPLLRDNIISRVDPDIKIESTVISEAKDLANLQKFSNLLAHILQDPNANRKYALKKYAKLSGLRQDEINKIFPKSIDEWEAEKENENLNKNKPAEIRMSQNHDLHLEIHEAANPTASTEAHILAHKIALLIGREQPEILPEQKLASAQEQQSLQQKMLTGQSQPKPDFNTPRTLQSVR